MDNEYYKKMSIIGTITMLKQAIQQDDFNIESIKVDELLKSPYAELENHRDLLIMEYNIIMKNKK